MLIGPMVVAAASALAATVPGSNREGVVVGVTIASQADIPGPLLMRARQEVSNMYRDVGVRVVWRQRMPEPGQSDADIDLVIIIRDRPMPERRSAPGEMGAATGSSTERGQYAYIFLDRVRAAADLHRVGVSTLLALAIAHELGHLLLPDGRHSPEGVMRARWSYREFEALKRGGLRMTAVEGQLIRARFGK